MITLRRFAAKPPDLFMSIARRLAISARTILELHRFSRGHA